MLESVISYQHANGKYLRREIRINGQNLRVSGVIDRRQRVGAFDSIEANEALLHVNAQLGAVSTSRRHVRDERSTISI